MSVESVKEYLRKWNKDKDVMEFDISSATVELASVAVGVIPARIAKTLSFLLKDGSCALIVTAGDAKIDNSKYKHIFSCKAKMLTPEELSEFTGHPIGGVCPFDIKNPNVTVYLDESLKRFDTVFPAAGSSSSAVRMTCAELFETSKAKEWIDVCKLVE
ncbi:MAG: YbaK/EbsC family protein [Lachnospiraceae bacterium]|nr:YbaK/EbsC family protein [Lachnospiraceae bacterium]